MRTYLLGASALLLVGCGHTATTTFVKSDTTLGRVVVYRNGVAYFERYAEVEGDHLKLNVPSDKLDDFLKSLTVVDATTGEPTPISYPSGDAGGGAIDMKVNVGGKAAGRHKLRLSYVTEAPSWKPSYRVVVGKNGKVDLQGWAIVDNTSGEDWKNVRLGVGASSAMSFRFDLKGLRLVERETLEDTELFALAPPPGGATYGQGGLSSKRAVEISDESLSFADDSPKHAQEAEPTAGGPAKPKVLISKAATTVPSATQRAQLDAVSHVARSLKSNRNQVVVEGYASAADTDKVGASLARANKLRDQLIQQGVDASRIVVAAKGEDRRRSGGARLVETPPPAPPSASVAPEPPRDAKGTTSEPIGSSHFESATALTVPKGTSTMVSILRTDTEGEVVYLFDPEGPRGNAQFPFRTLRFRNPTDSALESGPVSVFGEGKFVGEGMAEPIPAHSVAFVPFALDRQIVVERKSAERDEISRILTIHRGVFSTEVKHTKKATFSLFNRMGEKATVYVKHTVAPGYRLTKFPDTRSPLPGAGDASDHLAGGNLFRIDLEPNAKVDVDIEEATPVHRTTDIRTAEGLDLVRVYLSQSVDGPLKGHVEQLLKLNADMTKIEQRIVTARDQMAEYRSRMDEIHAQLVTLKAVKTAGPLMNHLEKKLQEISERLSKSTVDVVSLQEQLMVARVNFQSGVADLTLESEGSKATASR